METIKPKKLDNSNLPPLGELHPLEHRLILAIRFKYNFSDILLKTRYGLPYRFILTERFEDLGSDTFIESFKGVDMNNVSTLDSKGT